MCLLFTFYLLLACFFSSSFLAPLQNSTTLHKARVKGMISTQQNWFSQGHCIGLSAKYFCSVNSDATSLAKMLPRYTWPVICQTEQYWPV
jgi:hypothetical protein